MKKMIRAVKQVHGTFLRSLVAGLLVCGHLSGFFLAGTAQADDKNHLAIALLPILDSLPAYVALENGYFAEEGLVVEPLRVASAVERDQLMQAKRIDAMLNEVSGAALFNRDKIQLKIVCYSRVADQETPIFRVLAAKNSKINTIAELAGVPIGVSKNTIIEYVTERLLTQGGLDKKQITTRSVPVLPERLQLLLSGQIKAATLPDPLGFAAMQAGAVEVARDFALDGLSASVISFSQDAVEQKAAAIKKFVAAWDRAAADLNADPEKYRALILKKIRVPKNVQETFLIPKYSRGKNVSEAQWDDAVAWLLEKKLLSRPVAFQDAVTTEFLATP